jgi:UrcA family protein
MTKSVFTPIIASALALTTTLGLAIPTVARAETATIATSDLNLSSEAGQSVLQHRIERAAKKVCGLGEERTGTRVPSRSARACYARAVNDARVRYARTPAPATPGA